MYFQDVILTLQRYWAEQGCVVEQPSGVECGAGTFNPNTFLRVLGPEPWSVAYVDTLNHAAVRPTAVTGKTPTACSATSSSRSS